MAFHFYLPAGINEWNYNYPAQTQNYYPSYGATLLPSVPLPQFSLENMFARWLETQMINTLPNSLYPIVMFNEDEVAAEVKAEIKGLRQHFLYSHVTAVGFGFGTDKFIDRGQWSEQALHFYPLLENQSQYKNQIIKPLSSEFTTFIDSFEKVVYISFGSMLNPTQRDTDRLIGMVKKSLTEHPQIGYILVLMKSHP